MTSTEADFASLPCDMYINDRHTPGFFEQGPSSSTAEETYLCFPTSEHTTDLVRLVFSQSPFSNFESSDFLINGYGTGLSISTSPCTAKSHSPFFARYLCYQGERKNPGYISDKQEEEKEICRIICKNIARRDIYTDVYTHK